MGALLKNDEATRETLEHGYNFTRPTDSPSMKEWEAHFPGIFDNFSLASGAANIILQLANPAVGYGVKESIVGNGQNVLFTDPVRRARTTFTYLAVAFIGSAEDKLTYRSAVNKSHKLVRSTEASPVKYNAFNPELQLWVASCLYFGFRDVLTKFRGEPSREDAEKLLRMSEPLATTLQVRSDQWHKSLDEFDAYWEKNLNELTIDDTMREYLMRIVNVEFLPKPAQWLFGGFNRFVTSGFLPPQIRQKMHLQWTPSQQKRFDLLMSTFGFLNRMTPLAVRGAFLTLMLRDLRKRMKEGRSLI